MPVQPTRLRMMTTVQTPLPSVLAKGPDLSTAASANPTAPSGAVARDATPPAAAPAAQTPPKA